MTIARQTNKLQSCDPFMIANEDGMRALRYQVMVRRLLPNGRFEYLCGSIVSHLVVEDYCQQHGLILVETYPGTRTALKHERTELF